MLSPVIRAAAAQFANSQLGKPTMPAIALAYETGYHAGFIARPKVHRFPLSGQREFLRVLGLYVAEEIDIYHPATGRYGKLKGLPATYEGQGEPLADVEFYADAEAREEGGGDLLEPASKILPVLYSFEDLATELVLADGRRVVPAVEVAKLLPYAHKFNWDEVTATLYQISNVSFIRVGSPHTEILEMYESDYGFSEASLTTALAVGKLLRELHVAVGLRPEQYRRKVVAAKPEVRICDCETDPPCHCGEGEASHRLGCNEHSFVPMHGPCTGDCPGCTGGKLVVSPMNEPDLNQLPF